MKALAAGSEIDSWCTKCKMDLGHRIVALVEKAPKRVVCLTCNSTHNYRAPKDGPSFSGAKPVKKRAASTAAAAKPARRTAVRVEADRLQDWEAQVIGKATNDFTRYTIAETFDDGDLVLHKKFGEGYVTELLDGGKVLVMFQDQERTLVHGRS